MWMRCRFSVDDPRWRIQETTRAKDQIVLNGKVASFWMEVNERKSKKWKLSSTAVPVHGIEAGSELPALRCLLLHIGENCRLQGVCLKLQHRGSNRFGLDGTVKSLQQDPLLSAIAR
jgi:hypothetical protein